MKKEIWRIVFGVIMISCSSVWAEENNLNNFSDVREAEETFGVTEEVLPDDDACEMYEFEENPETYFTEGEAASVFSDQNSLISENELEAYTETVPLLQNGEMVSQYFEGLFVNTLSDEEDWKDSFRTRISYAMQNCEEYVYVDDLMINKQNDIDSVRLIYRSCIKGNRYYISGSFSYYCNSEMNITKIKIGYYSSYCDSEGKPDKSKITESLSVFDSNAEQAVSYASKGRNELEQMLLAHDWIVRECDYDYDSLLVGSVPNISYNAYGCLVQGSAVCNGYALAYSYILEKLGYSSYVIASDSMNHAWNMVNIDSNWFHVDTTWDDPVFSDGTTYHKFSNHDYSDEGFVSHTYFLKNDSEMESLNHHDWRLQNSEVTLPVSSSQGFFGAALFRAISITDFSLVNNHWYYVQNGRLCSADDLWGTNQTFLSDKEIVIDYAHALNGLLYFTDFKSIYCWNPVAEMYEQVLSSENTISELTVKKGQLIYILVDGESFQRCVFKNETVISAPSETKIVSIVPYTDRVKISWEKVENADGYVLYYSDKEDGNYKVLKRVDSSDLISYSHRFNTKTTYYYKIRTFIIHNGSKVYSDYSDVAIGKQIPSQITGMEAYFQESDSLFLFWDLCEGADGYVIYESEDSGNTWKIIKTMKADNEFYKKKGVVSTNLYRVRSFIELNGKKIMGAIPDKNCKIDYLLAPTEFSAVKASMQKVKLTWNRVDLADGYVIYRSTNGGAYKVIKTIKDNTITYYNNTIVTGSNNSYRIRAYKEIHNQKLYGSISAS